MAHIGAHCDGTKLSTQIHTIWLCGNAGVPVAQENVNTYGTPAEHDEHVLEHPSNLP